MQLRWLILGLGACVALSSPQPGVTHIAGQAGAGTARRPGGAGLLFVGSGSLQLRPGAPRTQARAAPAGRLAGVPLGRRRASAPRLLAVRCAAGDPESGIGDGGARDLSIIASMARSSLQAATYAVLDVVGAAKLTHELEGLAKSRKFEKMAQILSEPSTLQKIGPSEALRLWNMVPDSAVDMAEAHIESCHRHAGSDTLAAAQSMCEAAEFLGVCACYYEQAAILLDTARVLIDEAGSAARAGEVRGLYLSVVAQVRGSAGEFDRAREALLEGVRLKEARGAAGADVAADVISLAGLARQAGQLDEALLLCRRAEKLAQEASDGGLLALATAELAAIHQETGDYDRALVEARTVLDLYRKELGDEHPVTAAAMDALGVVYQRLGQYEKAKQKHMQALAVKEQVLGSGHLDVASTLQNLGVCADEGDVDYAKGREWKEKALAILRRSLPALHPHVGNAIMSLGESARATGDFGEAQQCFEQACQIFRASLGNSHPLLATAMNNLGQVHRVQGRYDESLLLMEQSVSIKKECLAPNHPSTATGLSNLAAIWEEGYKDFDRALQLRRKALGMAEASLGPDHPQVAVLANNLGVLLSKMGQYGEANELYEQALRIDEAVYGEEHPQTATDLNNLATLAFHVGEWHLSRGLYERALGVRERALGAGHAKTCATRRNLALVEGRIAEAEGTLGG